MMLFQKKAIRWSKICNWFSDDSRWKNSNYSQYLKWNSAIQQVVLMQ